MGDYRKWQRLRVIGDDVPLNDDYPQAVAFVCIQRSDGTYVPIGTGFFIGWPKANGGLFRYLVTARHIAECGQPTFVRVATHHQTIIHRPIGEWCSHDSSDVAVAATAPEAFIGAIAPVIKADDWVDKWPHQTRIVRGNVVYFLGLLTNVPSMSSRVIPMMRSGTIGAMYVEGVPVKDGTHERTEPIVHLIDGYSRAGHSGSPCIVEQAVVTTVEGRLALTSYIALLGVIVGHFDGKVPIELLGSPEWETGMVAPANSGIATVVPVEALRELLNDDERLVGMRDEENERDRRRAEREPFEEAATTDSVVVDEFGEFEDLTRKLMQVPKSEIDEERRKA